jgi:hypothetical protein
MKIDLDYVEFKTVVTSRSLFWQYIEKGNHYILFCVDNPLEFSCEIEKGTDEAVDFETNYKADANRPLNLSTSSTTSVFGSDGETCWGIVPSGVSEAYLEWQFDYDCYFNKMYAIIQDAEWAEGEATGDYVRVSVHMPDDTKIREYSGKIPCWGNQPQGWMQGTGAGKLPAYLKLRVTYTKGPNTSEIPRRFCVIPEFLV